MNSTAIVRVTVDIRENILTPENPIYKERGTTMFDIEVDAMTAYKSDGMVVTKSVKRLLEEINNDNNRFEYISHEVLYGSPHKLDSNRFKEILKETTS